MRWLRSAARAAALLGIGPRQDPPADSVQVVDELTGFTFGQYVTDNGISFRIAIPKPVAADAAYDVVVQVAAPIEVGWAGIGWGGSMTYNPLTIGWKNGEGVMTSSRFAFGYYVPPAYENATYTQLAKGTFVNATHWQYTAKCSGCSTWGDDDIGFTTLDASAQNALAFAFSQSPPDEPANNQSIFTIHDSVGHWYHDFGNIGNENFDELVTKNSEGPVTSAAGGSTGTPTITTPQPTTTASSAASTTASSAESTTASSAASTTASTTESATTAPTSSSATSTASATTSASAAPAPSVDPLPFPSTCEGVAALAYPQVTADGWKSTKIAGGLTTPRTVIFDSMGNMLVLQASVGISVHTFGPDGCLNSSTMVLANRNLNHGLTLSPDSKSLYASSMTTVWRWAWDPATRKLGEQTVIIIGMNNGGHNARAIYISPNHPNIILASVGSNDNWDYEAESMTAGRAAVKAFDMDKLPAAGFTYTTDGYQFGYGLRNEVGLVFDPANNVWGVENGGDDFKRTVQSRATDIHNENPADELNYLGDPSKPNTQWYGYPTCHTVWDPSLITDATFKTGDQFVVTPNATFGDDACKEKAKAPRLSFQAHSAPISAAFDGTAENMYVTLHGSWDRTPPTGYKLIEIPFKKNGDGTYEPVAAADSREGYKDILSNKDVTTCGGFGAAGGCFRPAAVAWDSNNARLVVSSDAQQGELYIMAKA